MRLDYQRQQTFSLLFDDLGSFAKHDAEMAKKLGTTPNVLAKLKRGDLVADTTWEAIKREMRSLPEKVKILLDSEGKSKEESQAKIATIEARVNKLCQNQLPSCNKDFEMEMVAAFRTFEAFFKRDKNHGEFRHQPVVVCKPPEDNILRDNVLLEVSKEIENHLCDLSVREERLMGPDPVEYHRAMEWNVVRLMGFWYLFPFYLTNNRRQTFGCIPYGKHRRLGVILPKKWFKQLGSGVDPDYLCIDHIKLLLKRHAEIHSITAHSATAQQIVFDAVVESSSPENRTENAYLLSKSMRPGCNNIDDAWAGFLKGCSSASIHIFIYNLYSMAEVKAKLSNSDDMQLCTLVHGANVPVGVGFSLPCCDYLKSKEGKFAELRQVVLKHNRQSEFRKYLSDIGIDLDPE